MLRVASPIHVLLSLYPHPNNPSPGNLYKNKRVLMEKIHSMKAEKNREKALTDQKEARLARSRAKKDRAELKAKQADQAEAK